jgi:CelD/BcsL family acetyltransferase involved in cellulose biosynthesis
MGECLLQPNGRSAEHRGSVPRPARAEGSAGQPKREEEKLHLAVASDDCLAPASPFGSEWDALSRRLNAPPQLRSGWLTALCDAFGARGLKIHIARRGPRLVGVFPTIERRGVIRAAINAIPPGFGGLLADDPTVADELVHATFSSQPRHVSAINLDPAGEAFRALQHGAHSNGYRILIRHYRCSPCLVFSGSWEEYESRLSKKLLKGLRYKNNRIRQHGKLSFEVVDGSGDIEKPLREAYEVEGSGWKGEKGTAILSSPRTTRFWTTLARWAADHGMFRLYFLRLDGRAIAMSYQLEQDGVSYWQRHGYLADFARYSPSMLLFQRIIRHNFSAGLSRMDFCGIGERYQFDWTRTTSEWLRLEAFAPTLPGYSAMAAFVYARPLMARLPLLKKAIR